MDYNKPLLVSVIVVIGIALVFAVNAYEKQMQEQKVIKLSIEKKGETDDGQKMTETDNIIVYKQEDVEAIEEKLRELGYIE